MELYSNGKRMIGIIKDLLALDEWYGQSKEIEIAKGKNKLQTSFIGAWYQNKRKRKWHK